MFYIMIEEAMITTHCGQRRISACNVLNTVRYMERGCQESHGKHQPHTVGHTGSYSGDLSAHGPRWALKVIQKKNHIIGFRGFSWSSKDFGSHQPASGTNIRLLSVT